MLALAATFPKCLTLANCELLKKHPMHMETARLIGQNPIACQALRDLVRRSRSTPSCRSWSRRFGSHPAVVLQPRPAPARRPASRRPSSTPASPGPPHRRDSSRAASPPAPPPGAWPSNAAPRRATCSATTSASSARRAANTRVLAVTPGILLRTAARRPVPRIDRRRRLRRVPRARAGDRPGARHGPAGPGNVRPDLKIVVMSATLQAGGRGGVPGRLPGGDERGPDVPGRDHDTSRRPRTTAGRSRPRRPWPACSTAPPAMCSSSCPAWARSGRGRGPGRQLIGDDVLVLPLHGDLPAEEQDRALLPQGRRKVVLATNVAETSVTVEGVTAVVDTGLARQLIFDPSVGLDRLELVPSRGPRPTSGPAGRGGRSRASASGSGARCRTARGRRRPSRRSAASTWPGRRCSSSPWASASRRSPGSTRRRARGPAVARTA